MTSDQTPRASFLRPDSIPNLLTGIRFVLAILYPIVPSSGRMAVLIVALITEYLDGAVARRFGWESRSGRILDPIADKLLFAVVAVTLLVEDRLSWLEVLALGIRDLVVAAGSAWLAVRGRWTGFLRMPPQMSGKVTTVLQYGAFFAIVAGYELPVWFVVAAAAVGAVAAVQYVTAFHRATAASSPPKVDRPPERAG
jgi:phosphatidylglycerophosphate synthase